MLRFPRDGETDKFLKGISWKEVPHYDCTHPKNKFRGFFFKDKFPTELPHCAYSGCPIYGEASS